jgi:2-methylisocitrate lyase-like PEP mutase family enzyme
MGHPSLNSQLTAGEFILAPGVYDGLSARIADAADFGALYLSGYAVSASLLAKPDAGFLTLPHMEDRIRTLCAAIQTPLIADADTGFSGTGHGDGAAQVGEAVRQYESAGAAAIQLEDQVFPKRCGHTKGREVIAAEDFTDKIQMAVEARASDDFLVIARTDARTSLGFDEALRRCEIYLDAGADILFLESPESEDELEEIGKAFPDTWLMANMVEGGSTPILSPDRLKALGFSIAIYPLTGLSAAAAILQSAYGQLKNGETFSGSMPFDELNRTVGFEEIWELDKRFEEED